ncbi:hypothetical protein OROGR_006303 [Orobanche gracilis]
MGKKAKSSRKGKKAWRANISTEDFENYFEKSKKDALSGGSLADAPIDSLFFVDKTRDLSVKRKRRAEKKYCDVIVCCRETLLFNQFRHLYRRRRIPRKLLKLFKQPKIKMLQHETEHDSDMVDLWEAKGNNSKIKKKPKTCVIPAVEVDPPGFSFNPETDSHQDALARAVADEIQQQQQHLLQMKCRNAEDLSK